MSKFIFLLAIIFVSAAGGVFIGQQSKSAAISETAIAADTKKPDFIKILQNENILNIKSWEEDEGKKFFGVTRQLNEPCDKDSDSSSCQKFSIYDEKGKVFYELKDNSIYSIDFSRFMPDSRQLVIETNSGGTDDSLTVVNYKNGKFTKLNVEGDTSLRGGWWTMPQYGSGVTGAYFKPEQLIVIQQIGGGDNNPKASVFRFKTNKLQKVGAVKMAELGDFIEKQIAVNK